MTTSPPPPSVPDAAGSPPRDGGGAAGAPANEPRAGGGSPADADRLRTDAPACPAADRLQARLDRYWSGRADAYHRGQADTPRAPHDRAAWAAVFGSVLPPRPARILDVGTGSGFLTHLLAGPGHDVTGLDSAEGMLRRARLAGDGPRFVHGDALAPAAALGGDGASAGGGTGEDGVTVTPPFDAVASRYVLWTLPDPVGALRAWSRLVRPGGVIASADGAWFPEGIPSDLRIDSADGPDAFISAYAGTGGASPSDRRSDSALERRPLLVANKKRARHVVTRTTPGPVRSLR
ncbi:class I SAM-dependent methyltransferase [Corynebacterium sp. 335C]